jgi:SH3 domain-containing YSC84-like protein 1
VISVVPVRLPWLILRFARLYSVSWSISGLVRMKGRAAAAETDIVMRAEVLSYSRSRGLFAGISLEGSTLRSDGSANKKLYGREVSAKNIVREGEVGVPASGRELIALLNKESPKNLSDPKSLKE